MKTTQKTARLKQQQQLESQEQNESSQFSQSLQSIVAKVQACEDASQADQTQVEELSEICERQQQNHSELLRQYDQLKFRYDTGMKHQDALLNKYDKVIQMFTLLGGKVNMLTDCLQRAVDIQNMYGMSLDTHKESLQHLHRFHETMCNVSIPSNLEHFRKQLHQKKEWESFYRNEIEEEFGNTLKQNEFEETTAEGNLSNQKTRSCDIHKQILAENEEVDNLRNNEATLLKEKEELKQSLKHQLEILSERDNDTEHDIQVANEEKGRFTIKKQNQQIELLQKKEREGRLNMDLEPMKANAGYLSGSLSKKRASINDLSKLLDAETKNSITINTELDAMKLQLHDIERNINRQINELSEEELKISANVAEIEESLQEQLNIARKEEADIQKEDGNVQQSLIHTESQIQAIHDAYSEACQSITVWENNLVDEEREIVKLNNEERTLLEHMSVVSCATQALEQSLTQIKTVHDKSIFEFENQLVCTEEEKSQANAELESLNLSEQILNNQIEEVQRVSAYSDAEMKEHNENILRELQDQIAASENEFDSINADCLKEEEKLQHNLKLVVEAIENKNMELNSYEDSIQKNRSQLDDVKISHQITMEQSEKQGEFINDLNLMITGYIQKEELQILDKQSIALKLEQICEKIKETANLILSLEFKHQQLLAESEKAATDHKTEKQIFMRDLVNFQQTAECRLDEEKCLLKQRDIWKDKYEKSQQQLPEMISALTLRKQEINQDQQKLAELRSEMQNAKDRLLQKEKTFKSTEKEAQSAKKRLDHLRNKILAYKAAKKKDQEKAAGTLNLPSNKDIPSQQTTPHQLPPKSDKEITPRSILKSSSKPPTPLKTVTFVEDFDDAASSSSSIVMGPELADRVAANPGAARQIMAEYRESFFAAKAEKRMLKQRDSNSEMFKTPSQELAPSNNTTPQFASGHDKENASHPTLKSSLKPPTPQEHYTNIHDDDFDDGASSSSSIVMGPELAERVAANPGAVRQIMTEYRESFFAAKAEKRKLKQQGMDNEPIHKLPTKNVTPSKNTTPQFASSPGGREITPRSILKSSSNPPTPQKKTVQFVDVRENENSSSSSIVDPEPGNRPDLSPRVVQQIAAEHIAAKRIKLSRWDDNNTNNEISSSTPEK